MEELSIFLLLENARAAPVVRLGVIDVERRGGERTSRAVPRLHWSAARSKPLQGQPGSRDRGAA